MDALLKAIAGEAERARYNRLAHYLPFGHPDTLCPDGKEWKFRRDRGEWQEWSNKPWQFDFHAASADHQERMLMAANRPGKSLCAAAEVAMHATGRYPVWWRGKRFTHPVLIWTGSPTNEGARDIVQKALFGGTNREMTGTGFIPRECILKFRMRQAGVSDVIDKAEIRNAHGGITEIVQKTYEQGWRKWQGTAPHVVWLDEEPDTSADQKPIYTEALTRLLTSHGTMMVTFTPLLGQTPLVEHFQTGGAGVWLGTATWEDAPHLLTAERERLAASYPLYEREARMKGVPMMGEGRVFKVAEEEIAIPPMELPDHWPRICGIDFGQNHPAACAWLAWDRDADVVYLYADWKKSFTGSSDTASTVHSAAIVKRGRWIPVAWPHDGVKKDPGSGRVLKSYYAMNGVNMLGKSARYKSDTGGAQPVWPIIDQLSERMQTGRFKVFRTCRSWLDEFRSYYVKDGKLKERDDDALKASFYGLMMLRYAVTQHTAYRPIQSTPSTVFSTAL